MVSSRAAERFDALSTRTRELDDRSNRSLPGRPRPHIRHGLLLEDPHSAISKANWRGDENHSGITRNWRQYAESARGLRGYGRRVKKLEQPVNQKPAMMDGSHERQSMGSSAGLCHGAGQSGTASAERGISLRRTVFSAHTCLGSLLLHENEVSYATRHGIGLCVVRR